MIKLIKHKAFISTFLLTYFLFFFLTMYVLEIKSRGFGVGSIHYGFPFTYFSSYCFAWNYWYWGLAGNMLFATLLGIFVGLSCSLFWLKTIPLIWAKVSDPKFRQKWYL